ncbi:MAG TPA: M42 family metallopeptidase [Methanomassiliicoccales archaeon]|nr:M42 family metallopeptidase [Methanomassiliicoccales archaeon]
MDSDALRFFEELSNSSGPSGFEKETLELLRRYATPYSDSVYGDKLGNLFFEKNGNKKGPCVLVPAHVDEIGFLVTAVNQAGYLNFTQLGGWFDQVLLGQRIQVMTKKGVVKGLIASKPPHVMDAEERKKVVAKDKMLIDIGASNKEEAEAMGVRIGDAVVPESSFRVLTKKAFKDGKEAGERKIAFGKAFDNRASAFMGAELLRRLSEERIMHPNRVVVAGTVQEEVGARGAKTAANLVKPDVALVLDVGISGDVPGIEPQQAPSKIGGGVEITVFDAMMIPNQPLKELAISLAEENKIPYQLGHSTGGGTDGAYIHTANIGCPTLNLGVPVRHIHSHIGVLDLGDVESGIRLTIELLKRLDKKTVESLTT